MYEKTLIVYFSGTGGTKRVAEAFCREFDKKGSKAQLLPLDRSDNDFYENSLKLLKESDHLMLLFPVHAADAPDPVYRWIERMPGDGKHVSLISVSGGGDVWPNKGCHVEVICALEAKGFEVRYESMMVMPPNVFTFNSHLAMHLINALPDKAEAITSEIISGKILRLKNRRKGAFVRWLSHSEKKNSYRFVKYIEVTDDCTGCGWCAVNCPRDNIKIEDGKPVFSEKCIVCLRCIYGCPLKALKADSILVLKKGFSLDETEKSMNGMPLQPAGKCMRGMLWAGVRKYLKEK